MKRSWQGGWIATSLCVLPLLAAAQSQAPAPQAAATVNAVWVERKVSFTYMPLTSYYSCDGLRDKISWILRELGAKPGFKVRSRGCVELQGPELMPGVEIVAALPAGATPELLQQLAGEASKRQLAARATGKPDPVTEATAQFPARVKRVDFVSTRSALDDLQDGDCELMEQLVRNDVFGKLGARVVDARTHCVPRQVTLGAVRMSVEVLEPVPAQ
jgi:hypothetical protein